MRRAALFLVLVLAACSSSDDVGLESAESTVTIPPSTAGSIVDETSETTATTAPNDAVPVTSGGPDETDAPTTTTETAREPFFGSFETTIELLTNESGGGIRPDLTWTDVPGADHYGAYLYAPSGQIYWAWRGFTTTVPVGGEPRLLDSAVGPSVAEGMTWAVIAFDADGLPLAASPIRSIAP